jgi:hypothetical protein
MASGLDLALASVSRSVFVTADELRAHGRLLRDVWEYRPIGVALREGSESRTDEDPRRWLLVRPGIERPLAGARRRLVIVFDLNGVLGAKLFDAGGRLRMPQRCQARCGPLAFVLRPGAAKLLRVCEAAGHEVWIWSTMQRSTVSAFGRAVAPWLPPGRLLCAEDCEGGGPGPAKDLRVVWARSSIAGPDAAARTLLLDDDASKGRLQPECVAVVPPFAPSGPYDFAAVSDRGALSMLAAISRAAWAR